MDCKTVRGKLGEYIDGAAGGAEKQMIEEHLSSCRECSAELEDLRKTVGRLARLEEVEPPPWLSQRVMARIREEKRKTPLVRRLFHPRGVKIPLGAAATVVIAVATLYVFRTVQQEVAPEKSFSVRQERPEIQTKSKETGPVTGREETPHTTPKAPENVARREATPPGETAPTKALPSPLPAPGAPAQAGKIAPSKGEETAASLKKSENMASERTLTDVETEVKSRKNGGGSFETTGALRKDRMREVKPEGYAAARSRKSEKVLWRDESLTKDDMAKVMRLVLVRETKDELVFDVEYYLSEVFSGNAIIGVYPDIQDRMGGEVRALPGRHTVRISVSCPPSAAREDSRNLNIEIVRQEDAAPRRPLFRRVVPFVKRWEAD